MAALQWPREKLLVGNSRAKGSNSREDITQREAIRKQKKRKKGRQFKGTIGAREKQSGPKTVRQEAGLANDEAISIANLNKEV